MNVKPITSADIAAYFKQHLCRLSEQSKGECVAIYAESTRYSSLDDSTSYKVYIAPIGFTGNKGTIEEAVDAALSTLHGAEAVRILRQKAADLLEDAAKLEALGGAA